MKKCSERRTRPSSVRAATESGVPIAMAPLRSCRGEASECRLELVARLLGLGLAFARLLDDLWLGLGDELLVAELPRRLVDLAVEPRDLLGEAGALLGEIHDIAERQQDGRLVENALHGALRRLAAQRFRALQPRQAQDEI